MILSEMTSDQYHHGDLKNALIKAGIKILADEGIGGLSLRKVAKHAGVSHSAPYAHFSDKQALIAAIATEGHTRIYERISAIIEAYNDPLQQLVRGALAYLEFGLEETDLFRITFSGVLAQERDYPAFVEISQRNFQLIRQVVERCQANGVFPTEPANLIAQSLWGAVHGLVSLLQQGQVSSSVLDKHTPHDLLLFTLDQMMLVQLDPQNYS